MQSKAQIRATEKYKKAHYDFVKLTLKKGLKDELRAQADAAGVSLNAYIIGKLFPDMEADGEE